jgi:NADH:ubiquinone oxidoreductase subunit 6 (subunit J)
VAIPETIPILGIPWDDVLFVILAGTMLASGIAVVVLRDIIRCGLAMMVCFGALAGIYVMAGAPLVGAAQVLVYIGAISVLILFAIMLTQTKSAPTQLAFQTQAVPAAVAAIVFTIVVLLAVGSTAWNAQPERGATDTHRVAISLFSDWVLPFEIVGVLLLAAVIGGVFLAKRERGKDVLE